MLCTARPGELQVSTSSPPSSVLFILTIPETKCLQQNLQHFPVFYLLFKLFIRMQVTLDSVARRGHSTLPLSTDFPPFKDISWLINAPKAVLQLHRVISVPHVCARVCVDRTFIHSSMALQPFVGPWPLLQFRNHLYKVGRTPWTGNQPVARPLPTHKATQTQNKRTQISMPWVGFELTIPTFERVKTVRPIWSAFTGLPVALFPWNHRKGGCVSQSHFDTFQRE
jgi:hypothetical protein